MSKITIPQLEELLKDASLEEAHKKFAVHEETRIYDALSPYLSENPVLEVFIDPNSPEANTPLVGYQQAIEHYHQQLANLEKQKSPDSKDLLMKIGNQTLNNPSVDDKRKELVFDLLSLPEEYFSTMESYYNTQINQIKLTQNYSYSIAYAIKELAKEKDISIDEIVGNQKYLDEATRVVFPTREDSEKFVTEQVNLILEYHKLEQSIIEMKTGKKGILESMLYMGVEFSEGMPIYKYKDVEVFAGKLLETENLEIDRIYGVKPEEESAKAL